MGKPWEKFKKAESAEPAAEAGPWGKFAKAQPMRESGTPMDAVPDQSGEQAAPKGWLDTELPWGTARGTIQGAANALPVAGTVFGGVGGAALGSLAGGVGSLSGGLAGAGAGAGLGEAAKNMIESRLLGKTKTRADIYGGPAKAVVEGATAEMGGQALGAIASKAAPMLSKFAEKSAVNATGATGKQASEFADDAGRQLLDKKVVRFGDSQAKIAKRAGSAVDDAEKQIGATLQKLEAKGVKVDAKQIYKDLKLKIKGMKGDPSQADIAKMLEKEASNIVDAAKARGTTKFGVAESEKIKRGYNRKAGNWTDPEKSQAGKEMYQQFRHGVEDAATKAAPETAEQFVNAKKSYGLLAPIEEAAQRRAMTTAQSPPGGFLDVTSAAAGGIASGPVGAIGVPVARRLIAPRMSSSAAVGADKLAQGAAGLSRNPQVLSGLIKLGLIPQNPTDADVQRGLIEFERISGESP